MRPDSSRNQSIHPALRATVASVWEAWHQTAQDHPERPAFHIPRQACAAYSDEAIDYQYGEATAEIEELTRVYRDAGYGRGHKVALALDNRVEHFFHFLAINALGATIVPLNMDLGAKELGFVLDDCGCDLIVALAGHSGAISAALTEVGLQCPILTLEEWGALPKPDAVAGGHTPILEDSAAILYTSGTTGQPKGCILSNQYFLTVGHWYADIGGYLALRPGQERLLTPLPLFHVNAFAFSFMACVMTANCLIQIDRFHPRNWWQTLRDSQATAIHYLGVMPAILLKMDAGEADDFSDQIRFGFGAGVDPKHHEAFEARFGFPLVEGWAMTETGAAACIMVHDDPRHVSERCIGRCPSYLDMRIVNDEGAELTGGESGELLVRSKGSDPRLGFFSGYYGNDTETNAAWKGGWLHTGDVVRQNPDGAYFFVERRKNIIRRSGENIAAAEVESALLENPEIRNCAVAPIEDEIRGEEVMVLVEVADEVVADNDTATRIFADADASLAYYKVPAYIAFVDALPVTGTQKVQRRAINELCGQYLQSGTVFDFRAQKKRRT